jgi:hypothetical protein
MVAEGPATDFDRQSVIEYMTTGTLKGRPHVSVGAAAAGGSV